VKNIQPGRKGLRSKIDGRQLGTDDVRVVVEVTCEASILIKNTWGDQLEWAEFVDQNITSIKLGKVAEGKHGITALKAGFKVTFSKELMPLVEEMELVQRVGTVELWEDGDELQQEK